jgi:hypothetical protein
VDGRPSSLSEELVSVDLPVGWEVDSADAVEGLIADLSRPQRRSIRAMYLTCAGDRERLAKRMGLPRVDLYRGHREGIKAMRKAMGVNEMEAAG